MAKKKSTKGKPGTAMVPAKPTATAIAEKPAKPAKTKALARKAPTKAELVALTEAAELLTKIEEAEEACQQSRLDMDDAKESYKLAKQNYSHHVDELRRLVRARKEEHPLFDPPKQTVIDVEVKPAPAGQAALQGAVTPAPDSKVNGKANAWRYLEVDRLSEADPRITEKHLKALRASKYETLGELADMMDRRETFWHKEVKGIGKDGKQPIEDALGMIRARYETEQSEPEKPSESKESKED